jgi:hypothetical protein
VRVQPPSPAKTACEQFPARYFLPQGGPLGANENAELAKAFIDAAVISNGGIAPASIYADRGASINVKAGRRVTAWLSD